MQSGTYTPNLDVEVTAWPLPDAYGNGDPVKDDNGNDVKDQGGNVVKEYDMPDGFADLHGDGSGTQVNKKGDPVRDIDGNAINIVPGGAVVRFADGTVKSLDQDEAYAFSRAYSLKESTAAAPETPTDTPTDTPDVPEQSPPSDGGNADNPPATS